MKIFGESKKENGNAIRAMFVLEIIGRPAEHIIETLNNIIKGLEQEKGVIISRKDVKEAKKIEDSKDFYSSFAEIEFEVDDILQLTQLVFKYMPAYVQIISPEDLNMTNLGLSELLSELTRRLHGYDEVARVLQFEKGVLEKRLKDILEKKKD